jgi:hypothetical protein
VTHVPLIHKICWQTLNFFRKCSTFYGTEIFINMFQLAHYQFRTLSQNSPNIFQLYFRIILPSMHGSSKWSLSFSFPHLTVYVFLVWHMCYMSRPSHAPWFDYLYNIWWALLIIKFLMKQYSWVHCYFILGPSIVFNTLFSNTLSMSSSLKVSDQVSHP